MKNYFYKIFILALPFIVLIGIFGFSYTVMAQLPGGPKSPPAPACGKVGEPPCPPGNLKIIKKTIGGDKDSWFNFTLVKEATKDSPSIIKNLAVVANTPNPTAPNHKGEGTISLPPGKYKISELARDAEDWTFTGAQCSNSGILTGDGVDNVSIVSGGSVTCTFENNGQGTLKIITNTVGENEPSLNSRNFEYTIKRFDSGSPSQTISTVTVNTDRTIRKDSIRGDEYTGEKQIATDKGITVYTITQKIEETGWALDSVQCEVQNKESANPTGIRTQYAYGVLNVTVRGSRITTCTFKNTKKGELEIIENSPNNSGSDNFNYDINFVSTEYFPPNILPFAIASDKCGALPQPPSPPPLPPPSNQACTIDQDCNICKENCGTCSPPKPQPPGPGYSPSRITVSVNQNQTKRIYPGTYKIVEYLPDRSDNQRWFLNSVKCALANGQSTGESNVRGMDKVDVFAGKKTKCIVSHVLRTPVQGSGGGAGGGGSKEPPRPTQELPF